MRPATEPVERAKITATPTSESHPLMVPLAGGPSFAGTDDPVIPSDGESPKRPVALRPYAIGVTAVTVGQFGTFVDATGYVTDAERRGSSCVFRSQVAADALDRGGLFGTEWWRVVEDATWRNPSGSCSRTAAPADNPMVGDHPVVHVSWNDAAAYAAWAKGRLPTEAEWEHAARGGLGDVRYPWGDEEPETGTRRCCNIWHGPFPEHAGPAPGTIPADAFAPNGYGLYNMAGNVWEWTEDVFDNGIGADPGRRILKGGSFLCHRSYCFRYRIAARIGAPATSTTSHQGFRIAVDNEDIMRAERFS